MGKSKKNKNRQNDARGYVQQQQQQTNAPPRKTGAVVVSKETHENIQSIVGQLQHQQLLAANSNSHMKAQSSSSTIIDARFITKLTKIVQELLEFGFSPDQLEQLAHNLNEWTLDAALDWLCLNVSTLELPPLFTDGNLRDSLISAAKSSDNRESNTEPLTVLRFISKAQNVHEEEEKQRLTLLPVPSTEEAKDIASFEVLASSETQRKKSEEEAQELAEQKAKILQLYAEYCSDSDEHEIEGVQTDIGDETPSSCRNDSSQATVLQQELLQKEEELRELEDDLGNEANNYMRSKHETKQLQQQAKQIRKHIAGIKRKIEKEMRQKEEEEPGQEQPIDMVDENDSFAYLFNGGLFDSNDEDQIGFDTESLMDASATRETKPLIDAKIPKSWTGTTPQKMLEEACRKKKIRRPTFSKLPAKQGYKLTVAPRQSNIQQVCEWTALETDFEPGSILQDFLCLQALYEMDKSLPMHTMFPPSFRQIWLSWARNDQERDEATREAEQAVHSETIDRILSIISLNIANEPLKKQSSSHCSEHTLSKPMFQVESTWEGMEDDGALDMEPKRSINRNSVEGFQLRKEFIKRQTTPRYKDVLRQRKKLPMATYRGAVLDMVRMHPVIIICADTGAGKTTQCPQFLLEEALLEGTGHAINVICTQPRRVAATSVADRVAEEMADNLGNQVGYQIRMEAKKSSKTKLLFCTTGVLLRRLQDDRNLKNVTHVVVDEVHERQVQTDVLLVALKNLLSSTRSDLKVVLMSATMDPTLFSNFFNGAPVLNVPGRTFPVSEFFLEDILEATGHVIEEGSRYTLPHDKWSEKATLLVTSKGGGRRREVVDLHAATVDTSNDYFEYSVTTRLSMDRVDESILNFDLIEDILQLLLLDPENNSFLRPPDGADVSSGAVLIFLPGIGEIRSLYDRLASNRLLGDPSKFHLIPLHSKLNSAEQRKAFLPPTRGVRKIVLATNIAETSLTIPDVVIVMDSGREREVRRNKRTASSILVNDWCSKASTKQRAGRAGRIQPGLCLKLFSSKTAQSMKESSEPELKRVPLEEICLSILASGMVKSCREFLNQAPQPPDLASVQAALDVLQKVGAITHTENEEVLTPLGQHLARLPVDVRIGKMLVFGSLFRCLDKILTIAAVLSSKSPFESFIHESSDGKIKHRQFQDPDSDFATFCNVVEAYISSQSESSRTARLFCQSNCLNLLALRDICILRRDFLDLLSDIGFVSDGDRSSFDSPAWHQSQVNQNASNWRIVHAIVCAGLWPNVAVLKELKLGSHTLLHNGHELAFHLSSVNASKKRFSAAESFVCYFERFGTPTRESVSTTCLVNAIPLILFGGVVVVKHTERKVVVDNWIEIDMAAQVGVLLLQLRRQMDILLQDLLDGPDPNLKIDFIVQEIAEIL
ncbi:ATP-dependent helicase HrpA [Nitzschia inconspicua]|uniref:RNA helicase n=1 Tax=Nitzschia inconspicua TaxID=303405 RepID=A0A9K3KKG4_9STRA|nr:ATP-dependent helicase HrpA [Nitzschia inconspicua]